MTFRYKSYRATKKRMGVVGAFIELNELAIRDFCANAASSSSDVESFIRAAVTRHGMWLHYKNWPTTLSQMSRSYIIQICECIEAFFQEFRSEYQEYFPHKNWVEKNQKQSRIDNVLENVLSFEDRNEFRATFKYALYTYYIDVRHATVHPPNISSLNALTRTHQALIRRHRSEIVQWFPSCSLPNLFQDISFEDYRMFARAAKEIAADLSARSRPPDTVLYKVASAAAYHSGDWSEKRLRSRTRNILQTVFGLDRAEIDAILQCYLP